MADPAPRVFAYIRASTKKQVESPDTQKAIIKSYATFQNLEVTEYFVDAAKSGKVPINEREAGRSLMRQLRRGDHVIVAKIDRAFRRLKDAATVMEDFERRGIKLHVVNLFGGAIDLSSAMGKFLVHILAAFAELERSMISERTKDGLASRKNKGVKHTRFPGYGFMWEKRRDPVTGKMVRTRTRDDDERAVMKSIAMWRLQAEQYSWDQIHDHLRKHKVKTREGKEWSLMRIRRACAAEFKLQFREQRAIKG